MTFQCPVVLDNVSQCSSPKDLCPQPPGDNLTYAKGAPGMTVVMSVSVFLFFFFFSLFHYFEVGRASGGGAEREGDTESEAGPRLPAVSADPHAGLRFTNHEFMT